MSHFCPVQHGISLRMIACRPFPRFVRRLAPALLAGLALISLGMPGARADRIKNPTAVFSGLDKITGRIISFEVAIDETVQFGSLLLTPKVCWSRPPTEAPNTTSFLEVDEVTLNNEYRRIFTGWMFSSSPGLSAIEHAVYDVWLTECKGGTEIIVETKETGVDPFAPPERPAAGRRPGNPAAQSAPPSDRLDVRPQQGVPVQPAQEPSRRFFPTGQGPGQRGSAPLQIGPDPAGNSSR